MLSVIPIADPTFERKKIVLEGDVSDPSNPPQGCNFSDRCIYAQKICREEEPALQNTSDEDEHLAACHFWKDLNLQTIDIGSATG